MNTVIGASEGGSVAHRSGTSPKGAVATYAAPIVAQGHVYTGSWSNFSGGGIVGAFYASNVEQYLFQDGIAANYYASVATLPIDSTSVIIRSQGGGRGMGGGGFGGRGGRLDTNRICPIPALLAANSSGRIVGYQDIFGYCEP